MRSQLSEPLPLTLSKATTSNRRLVMILIIALPALLGASLLLFSTPWGIGASPDSAAFVGAARHIASGKGLFSLADAHQPPFYPVVLALTSLARLDPLAGARWLHALLFAANILLFVLILNRVLNRLWLVTAGAGLFLLAAPILTVHTFAWSESLFILLAFLGLILVASFIKGGRRAHFLLAALLIGLACLTRYAGISLVATAALAILFFAHTVARRRFMNAALFVLLSSIPLLLWLARNVFVAGAATSRQFSIHPAGRSHLWQLFYTLSGWLYISETFPNAIRFAAWLLLLAAVAFLLVLHRRKARSSPVHDGALPPLVKTLALFCAVYVAFLFFSISFFDANTPLDNRLLAPLFAAALPVVLFLFEQAFQLAAPRRWGLLVAAPLLLLCALTAFQAFAAVRLQREVGLGYNSPAWQRSELLAGINEIPQNIAIYSNAPEAILLLQGREAVALPRKNDAMTQTANQSYEQELSTLAADIENGSAAVAYFHALAHRPVTTVAELRSRLPQATLSQTADGVIIGLQRPPNP